MVKLYVSGCWNLMKMRWI